MLFCCRWYSFLSDYCHPAELQTFQKWTGDWTERVVESGNSKSKSVHDRTGSLGAAEGFVSSPGRAASSQRTAFLDYMESLGIMSAGIAGAFASRQNSTFIPRSSLQSLSNRVAQHPEPVPCSTYCAPSISQGQYRPDRHNPRALRIVLNASTWTAAEVGGCIHQRRLSGQHHAVRSAGIV
jgi:hypothetical protein